MRSQGPPEFNARHNPRKIDVEIPGAMGADG